jgi:hypothetical protein
VDRDLVEAARNGDREAYVDLIRARTDRLFSIAQRILRDIDLAEDALQDALVIAWRDLKGLRDPDRTTPTLPLVSREPCQRLPRLVAHGRTEPPPLARSRMKQ